MGCWLSGPWMGDHKVSGRSLAHLRILAASERLNTLQVNGQRGRGLQDCSNETDQGAWERLPLGLHHLNLPLPPMGVGLNASSPTYQNRHYYSYLSLPQEHCDGGRYSYLSSSPQDTVDICHQDPEPTSRPAKGQNCLTACCNANMEEPNSCQSQQTKDEDFMLEKPLGFLPLHHELDSGLGWTDGSLHQELSDSGFYSVSTREFRHFQRLLEKRMRLYNARMQHQGDACERRERRDSCPKSHRELLEAIPEALTMQPQCQRLQMGMKEGGGPVVDLQPQGLFRVSSVQFHKDDRPCLNRHSSSSGALFNPSHTHAAPQMAACVFSACSTPSSYRRPVVPLHQQPHDQQQDFGSVGMLRRSQTLHHRPPMQEYRRRASHPASPSYCSTTLHHCGNIQQPGLSEEREIFPGLIPPCPAGLALSPQQHSVTLGHIRETKTPGCYDNSANPNWWQEGSLMTEPLVMERDRDMERKLEHQRQMQRDEALDREQQIQEESVMGTERQQELEKGGIREQPCPQRHGYHPPQSSDINDTWPKLASRQSQGIGAGGGLYSTLENHTGGGSVPGWDANKGQVTANSYFNPTSSFQPKPSPSPKPNATSRISRNQLLRDRASQLADERSGMSTDEETNSDMLLGRYWSRTERREHFLLAREQKQQQQQARGGGRATRDASVGERGAPLEEAGILDNRGGGGAFAEGRCNTVLELSQRKLSRLRNRKLLDDWTTVEELLTHGTRLDSQEEMLHPSSLLTVTTV
ncbi:hypothetical protein LDENG_00023580 [Lucifuga dentata]|nr:hypothetical protein LDENG_00023580 [Lucifuga dentata]